MKSFIGGLIAGAALLGVGVALGKPSPRRPRHFARKRIYRGSYSRPNPGAFQREALAYIREAREMLQELRNPKTPAFEPLRPVFEDAEFVSGTAHVEAEAQDPTRDAKTNGSQAAPPEAEIVDDSGEVLGILLGDAPPDLSWYEKTKAQFSPTEQARIEGLWEGRMRVVRALKDCVAWAYTHHEFQPEGPGIHDRPCLLCGEPNLHDIHFIKAEAKR